MRNGIFLDVNVDPIQGRGHVIGNIGEGPPRLVDIITDDRNDVVDGTLNFLLNLLERITALFHVGHDVVVYEGSDFVQHGRHVG